MNRLPRVLILGRQNVGKSTLFNRLLRKRHSITAPIAGVTRDYVEQLAHIQEHPVQLLDSGGIVSEKNGLEMEVSGMSLSQMENADCILLMVSAAALVGEDEEIAAQVRPHAGKVILVANKIDKTQGDYEQAFRLGFDTLVGISAEHGSGIGELEEHIMQRIADIPDSSEDSGSSAEPVIRLSILGRPNVGKSTLMNTLLGYQRSLVHDLPGITRDSISSEFFRKQQKFRITDTAGIKRYARSDLEYYATLRATKSLASSDVAILVTDVQDGILLQDLRLAAMAMRMGVPFLVVLNKWDTRNREAASLTQLLADIRAAHPLFKDLHCYPCSAKTGKGLDKVLSLIPGLYAASRREIPTKVLNEHLHQWVQALPRRGINIRFITQTGVRPPHFLLFARHALSPHDGYLRYLRNQIRKDFQLEDVPIRLSFKREEKRRVK